MPRATVKASMPGRPMKVEIFEDVQQGSNEWHRLRCGIPTASMFQTVMRDGNSKTRQTYLAKLAGERITGRLAESFTGSRYFARGHEMEPLARAHYARTHFADLKSVGFIRNGRAGCSPDSLVDDEGLLEVKSLAPHLMIELLDSNKVPTEHIHQLQGNLAVSGKKWIDLIYFFEGFPNPPVFRFERDEDFIAEIWQAIDVFDLELRRLAKRMQG